MCATSLCTLAPLHYPSNPHGIIKAQAKLSLYITIWWQYTPKLEPIEFMNNPMKLCFSLEKGWLYAQQARRFEGRCVQSQHFELLGLSRCIP